MKRLITFISLIIVSLTGIFAMDSIAEERTGLQDRKDIDRLWKEYESSRRSDRPEHQMKILSDIKEIAKNDRLSWDFYKASTEYVSVGSMKNWKLRDSLETEKDRGFKEFDSAIISFYSRRNDLNGMKAFLMEHRNELEHGHNKGFYSDDHNLKNSLCSAVIIDKARNDYEYALWSVFFSQQWSDLSSRDCEDMLDEALAGRYPEAPIKEYEKIRSNFDDEACYKQLEGFAERNDAKAVSLLAKQDILMHEFNVLNEKNAGSEEFKALRERCAAFEKERGRYSGDEKKIAAVCKEAAQIIKELDSKSIYASIQDNVLTVLLRNLDKASVSLEKDGEKTFTKSFDNAVRSYYTYDTLTFTLPAMDDGEYDLLCESGKYASRGRYSRYTISTASLIDSKGPAVFAADAVTGKPLTSADIMLFDKKDAKKAEADGIKFDGFTYLPEAFKTQISKDKNSSMRIQVRYTDASGILHLSRKATVSTILYDNDTKSSTDVTYGEIFTDRGAFTPEETVQFKGLIYHGDIRDKLSVMVAGKKVTVRLFDAESNLLKSEDYTTNEFGSFAGSFFLPRQRRNGNYRLELSYQGKRIDDTYFRVDDFVLPTFVLSFDEGKTLLLPGDDVTVSGSLLAYSGHSLSDAKVTYSVSKNGSIVEDKALMVNRDGRFSISYPSSDGSSYQSYRVTIKVVDNTGETQEWSTSRFIEQSIPLHTDIVNKAEGRMDAGKQHEYHPEENYSTAMVSGDEIHFSYEHWGRNRDDMEIEYILSSAGRTIISGKASCADSKVLSMKGRPSGLYTLTSTARVKSASGKEYVSKNVCDILLTRDEDRRINADVENIFKVLSDGRTGLVVGSSAADTWIAIDLYGKGNVRLGHRMVHLDKKKELEVVEFIPDAGWSDIVKVTAIYFRNNKCYYFDHDFNLRTKNSRIPLRFTRFEDRTRPATPYSFEIQTVSGVECAASVFDKSTETIKYNGWNTVLTSSYRPYIRSVNTCGTNISTDRLYGYDGFSGSSDGIRMMKGASVMSADIPVLNDQIDLVEEEAIPFQATIERDSEPSAVIRENFANTIAFEPFLRSDENGKMEFNFSTADKLSTYIVQLFAHDKDMRNSVLREEMMVTIPVKVSVVEPQFLYYGDKYSVRASVSSNLDEEVKGVLKAEFYDGDDYRNSSPMQVMELPVALGAMGSGSFSFDHKVQAADKLGVKLTFTADDTEQGSDAIFFSIPVLKPEQIITESHSALLRDGDDKAALISGLRKEFVNFSGDDADIREISILQMLKEAIPDKVEPESDNVLDLSEAIYIRRIAAMLKGYDLSVEKSDETIVSEIMACRNSDGGFAWFKDFDSSPIITATVLNRIASLRARGLGQGLEDSLLSAETISSAVHYLDACQFDKSTRPVWCGGISFKQYVSIRSEFSEVPFETKGMDKEALKQFKKTLKEYLLPNKGRGLNGMILSKARRISVLMALTSGKDGLALADDWGISIFTSKRLERSIKADVRSLLEYAVEHKSGGWYYPNAVMPFRGLLESEAYAHTYISELLDKIGPDSGLDTEKASSISNGIRLWFMIQKESQDWGKDAGFAEALANVLNGGETLLNMKVIALNKSAALPFSEIKAAGNGMSISRRWLIETKDGNGNSTWKELMPGTTLAVGDKIRAEYQVMNDENRSYIKINAGRPAALRPVEQLSGRYGWWLSPLRVDGWYNIRPNGYRNVLKETTEYWFDVYPEEKTSIVEEFYVTQSGEFQTPAVTIESLYAPHYRANDKGGLPMNSK